MAPVPIGEIEGNDQFLTDLVIDCSCERFPRKLEDWERLGRALGANSVIQSLSLVCHPNAAYEQEIKAGMGLAVMVRYMAKNRCIDSLSIQNLVYTADTTSGDVFFMCLSKFTRDNYSLAHLELIELSTSGDFHYHMLAKGILESRSIRQLSVKDTRLGYCSFGILAQACKSSLKRLDLSNSNVNLRRLQLLVGSWAMDKNTPEYLDLGHNDDIDWESCLELSLLSVFPKHMKLNSCPIGDKGVKALLPNPPCLYCPSRRHDGSSSWRKISRLKTLTLRDTGIGLSACERLSRVLGHGHGNRIENLDLAENDLCDQSILTLVRSLRRNKSLRHINLMWNPRLTADVVWGAFSGILGQGATLYELTSVNHTLLKVYAKSQTSSLGLQVKKLLKVNSLSCDPGYIRREKIKRMHLLGAYERDGLLSDGGDVSTFVVPDILGWINDDTDGMSISSLGASFYLIRHNPWMFKMGGCKMSKMKPDSRALDELSAADDPTLPRDYVPEPLDDEFSGYRSKGVAKRMRV